MKVAILAYSTLEQSESVDAYNYYHGRGDDITIYYWQGGTEATDLPKDAKARLVPDEHTFDGLDEFDLIVRGAVVHPKDIHTTKPVTTVNNEFMEHCPAPIIGVTGTKGKGTTSTLITKMLEAAGKKVFLVGNIGKPPLSLLPQITKDDYVVYELSSFQLMDIKYGPRVGVCLMVVPEHLNWHANLQEYLDAKANLFRHQKPEDTVVFNSLNENSRNITSVSPAKNRLPYDVPKPSQETQHGNACYVDGDTIYYKGQAVLATNKVALLGRHNLENACAAIAAVWGLIDGNTEAINSVLTSFKGLEHRLEFVRELNGVKYYDDSFATTPETAIAAVEAFEQPKVLILGGSIKGFDFDELANALAKSTIRQVVLIGNTTNTDHEPAAPEIEAALHAQGISNITRLVGPGGYPMKEIARAAQAVAQSGDVVLLSTGCASYDMFQNYKVRGDQFKQAVQGL